MKLSQNLKTLLVSISLRFPSGLIRSTLRVVRANGFVVKQYKEVAREIVEGIEHYNGDMIDAKYQWGTLMDTSHDTKLKGYCPMLGGQVPFLYCRKCGNNQQPCWKIFDCWWETFDIVEFMQKNLSEDDFRQLLTFQPKAKITTLLELIEKTKE